MRISTGQNTGLAKVAVQCTEDTFELAINTSGEDRQPPQAQIESPSFAIMQRTKK